ncbi:MAG: tRNA pseudouridine(55) synthase TruB [Puniceicoccales bacterium]|jgi:tRNA pseudouridine55 synthase|nr:tRNA pseudouridine(55) synthase TruB [Puniceicoccales bacterium]
MRDRASSDEREGILLLHKPVGLTSHDVVARLRRCLGIRKIGHAGTLDPMASGLLILLVGRATKASAYFSSKDKVYEGMLRLGVTTATQDSDGQVLETREVPKFSTEELREALAAFGGDQYQLPPMYSAKKIHGKPLYKMARKGLEVEREPRFIHVQAFDLLAYEPPELSFRLKCSKGTYVRTLAHDLGQRLGCGAHLSQLCRLRSGDFDLSAAQPLEELERMSFMELSRCLIPLREAVPLPP